MDELGVLIFGPIGAGKGTQSRRLVEAFDLEHVETGTILRRNAHVETEYGTPAEYMSKGEYVPDAVVNEIVERELSEVGRYVLDGYPRTRSQAEFLDGVADPDVAIHIDVSEETSVERLSNRRTCPSCGATYHVETAPPAEEGACDECGDSLVVRDDDRPSVIRERIETYEERTAPVVEFYRERLPFVDVDGERPPDAVWSSLSSAFADAVDGLSN